MSGAYFQQLDEISKKRYQEKLTIGEVTLPDPLDDLLRENVFKINNYPAWPNISFGDIYIYLVVTKCFYTNESFENFKGLEAYNFLTSGKISAIRTFKSDKLGVVLLACEVQGSQALRKSHEPWAVAEVSGKVLCAHCTCMAGLGEACSHVAGLLFTIESGIREGLKNPSCTSEPCQWKKVSKKPDLMPSSKICFSRERKKKAASSRKLPGKPPKEAFQRFLNIVKKEIPNAPYFNLVADEVDEESTSSASENEGTQHVPNVIDLITEINHRIPGNISVNSRRDIIFKELCSLNIDVVDIEEKTRVQIKNSEWMAQRKGRLTSSLFHRVIHCRTGQSGIVKEILQMNPIETKEMRWGKIMEKKALNAFKAHAEEEHENVIIFQSTGLLVDKKHPFLGASIDGKMMCDCHPPAIIEIKCPYSIRNEMVQDTKSKNFFLDNEGCLKLKHPYYNQVQGQMAIWDVELCYFVTYTTIDINIQKIYYDEAYWQMQMPTLLQFYKNYVISEILDTSS